MSQQLQAVPCHAARVFFTSSRGHPPVWPDRVIPPVLTVSFRPPSTYLSWHQQRQLGWMPSSSLFRTPPCPTLGITGEPSNIGVPLLYPRPEPSARHNPTSMGEPEAGHLRVSCHAW